jgi:hypothetical protein
MALMIEIVRLLRITKDTHFLPHLVAPPPSFCHRMSTWPSIIRCGRPPQHLILTPPQRTIFETKPAILKPIQACSPTLLYRIEDLQSPLPTPIRC